MTHSKVRRLLLTIASGLSVLASVAFAQTFNVVHTFNGPSGVLPLSGVTIKGSVLYGTTLCQQYPGNCDAGTVYQLASIGSIWYYTPISLFSAGGRGPQARVLFGPDGHLYGTTASGGVQQQGLVFNLMPMPTICKTANCFWRENVLYQFTGSPDGAGPGYGDLAWDPIGDIYGTTVDGGTSNHGAVYQITESGNNWTETPIYSFTGPDGSYPEAGVVLDSNGNLFGTTYQGGLYGYGTVFELAYKNGIGWTETVLYNFQNLVDGQQPIAGLVWDSSGNLYGATSDGGAGGGGTLFELSQVGNSWAFTLLYSFAGPQGRNCGSYASLTYSSGNLYGTTACDGANIFGNVFELSSTPNGWNYASLHDFTGGPDGSYPFSNVTVDNTGTLYGTAQGGGNLACNPSIGCGTVWMIKP